MPQVEPLRIGELSRRTGCNIETIRYYERIGLLPRPPRTDGGRRAYGEQSIVTLNFVRRCRAFGFSLDDVRELLVQRNAQPCCRDVKSIAARQLEMVRAKLRDLAELEASLAGLVAQCSGQTTGDCAVLDALDAAGVEAGARG